MDTAALESAYDRFLDVARGLGDVVPPEGEWPPELVLAHVIVSDRMIAETAARVLAGGQPRFDNRASQSAPYLEAIARVAGSWDGLLAGVRQARNEVMATVALIEPEHGDDPSARPRRADEVVFRSALSRVGDRRQDVEDPLGSAVPVGLAGVEPRDDRVDGHRGR